MFEVSALLFWGWASDRGGVFDLEVHEGGGGVQRVGGVELLGEQVQRGGVVRGEGPRHVPEQPQDQRALRRARLRAGEASRERREPSEKETLLLI